MWQRQYGFLRLANFAADGDLRNYLRYSLIGELADGSFKVSDPLRWDGLDVLKLLARLVEQFGGGIDFTGSDLTQGQLSN